jgi:ParB-like chromosome segregation protein Spo0J
MKALTSVQMTPIEKVIPYENNPKIHKELQVQKIAKQISEFGFDQPIVVDPEFVIIKGHGRFMAAKSLGMLEVPVIVAELTKEQAAVARIADNKVAEAPWDEMLLKRELEALDSLEYDLSLTALDEKELALYLGIDQGDVSALPQSSPEMNRTIESQINNISHVKMLQLYLNDETFPEMMGKIVQLQNVLGTQTITDTVVSLVRSAHTAQFQNQP